MNSPVRVNLVVVGDPSWQLTHYGFGIWSRTDADIVALDRTILPSHGYRSESLGSAKGRFMCANGHL
jgi:hypothetical protein